MGGKELGGAAHPLRSFGSPPPFTGEGQPAYVEMEDRSPVYGGAAPRIDPGG